MIARRQNNRRASVVVTGATLVILGLVLGVDAWVFPSSRLTANFKQIQRQKCGNPHPRPSSTSVYVSSKKPYFIAGDEPPKRSPRSSPSKQPSFQENLSSSIEDNTNKAKGAIDHQLDLAQAALMEQKIRQLAQRD